MKIRTGSIDGFLRKPDGATVAVLLYGPDGGLVRERAQILARSVVPDLADPFRVAELTGAALTGDPPRLNDEAAALSLTGGRRVLRIRDAGDGVAPLFETFLSAPSGDALIIVEAGDLGPRSSLRRLFEDADNAVALPCYTDEREALAGLIRSALGRDRITVDSDALGFLVANLGSDRMITRNELEKLALYAGNGGRIGLEDAVTCVGDSAVMSLDDVALAVGDGDQASLERTLTRAYVGNQEPVSVLRAVARHFQRLHLTAGRVAEGQSLERAVGMLRPAVFFKVKGQFINQVKRWPVARLAAAIDLLTQAEIGCKTTGMPAETICARALMSVASAAGRC